MFAFDRDLLALEPNLFRDVSWMAQRLVSGTGHVEGAILKFATQDVPLDAAGVGPGFVVTVGITSYEVIERISDSQLGLSMLRASDDDPPLPVANVTVAAGVSITSFGPQIAIVHRQVMRMVGIEPSTHMVAGEPTVADIVNIGSVRHLEALGALHLIYSAAGALTPPNSPTNTRAEVYRRRFAQECQRTQVQLDLDRDGVPDAVRRLNIVQLVRT